MMYPAHIVTVDIIEERLARELFFFSRKREFCLCDGLYISLTLSSAHTTYYRLNRENQRLGMPDTVRRCMTYCSLLTIF
jgi:hypothetical protein